LYQCDLCGGQMKTRQGLSGHKQFRHGVSTLANIREPGTTQREQRERADYEMMKFTAEKLRNIELIVMVLKRDLEQIKQRLER